MKTIARTLTLLIVAAALGTPPVSAATLASLTYTGSVSGQHAEDLPVSARLETEDPDTSEPVPLPGREVVFSLRDGEGTELETAIAVTDDEGEAAASISLLHPVGQYALEVAFAGDEGFWPTSTVLAIAIETAQSKLTYTGTTSGVRGTSITLAARLQHARTNANLAGRTVRFSIPGQVDETRLTNGSGVASLSFPLTATYGSYPLTITWEGEDHYAGTTLTRSIGIVWTWTFTSLQGLGTVYLNNTLKEFRIAIPGGDSGVVPGATIQNLIPNLANPIIHARYATEAVAFELVGTPSSALQSFEAAGQLDLQPFVLYRTPS